MTFSFRMTITYLIVLFQVGLNGSVSPNGIKSWKSTLTDFLIGCFIPHLKALDEQISIMPVLGFRFMTLRRAAQRNIAKHIQVMI